MILNTGINDYLIEPIKARQYRQYRFYDPLIHPLNSWLGELKRLAMSVKSCATNGRSAWKGWRDRALVNISAMFSVVLIQMAEKSPLRQRSLNQ